MSRVFYIHDERGERRHDEAALPLKLGGSLQADIVMPATPADQLLAYIAHSEGHVYIQPADTAVQLFHNHVRLSASTWLKSGDEVQTTEAVMSWQVQGDEVTITTQARGLVNDLSPPAESPPSSPQRSLPDVATTPAARVSQRRAVLAVFVLLLLATAFVLLATPVVVQIVPEPDRQSLSGFPPVVTIGDRRLALPGRYTVHASREGHYPLQETIDVAMGGLQEFNLQLAELPGRVRFQLQPQVPFSVFVGDTPAPADADGVVEISSGRHQLRIETQRYLPVIEQLDIEGLGQAQTFSYVLRPGWADVTIRSVPAGAQVRVDGVQIGVTPVDKEIMYGPRTIELSLDKYKPVSLQQDIVAGSSLQLDEILLEPADGQLQIVSKPAGATISVAGVFFGTTPATIALASGVEHTVRLTKPGYQQADTALQLAAEEQDSIEVSLPPQYGVVFVKARPADASLLVDGKPSGKASQRLRLTTRTHSLEFRKPGYVTERRTVTPRAGVSKNIELVLKTEAQAQVAAKARVMPDTRKTSAAQTLRLVRPKDSFRMGASRREAGRRANESSRLVRLQRPFYLGVNEVSNGEYRAFKAAHDSGNAEGAALNGDRQPVVNISREDAARYCNWLSTRDGLPPAYRESGEQLVVPATTGYRLPTEAEWAYVARKLGRREESRYPWSGSFPPTTTVGNFADASIADTFANTVPDYNDGYRGTAPVGSFPAWPGGYHDLGGNVAEWTNDFYAVYPGAAEQLVTDPVGPANGEHYVVRGSSWRQGSIAGLRLSFRDYSRAARPDLGFRIARYAE